MSDCIFCKIINKELPAEILYEDEEIISFKDIHPAAKVHALIIPKKHIPAVTEIAVEDQELIGKIYTVVNIVAKKLNISETGFRVIVNCGEDGKQLVPHLHFHLLGGEDLGPKIVH